MCRPDPKPGLTARFYYFEGLAALLKHKYRCEPSVYCFHEPPGIKDAIEAMGIPHTEVDVIVANGVSVGFYYRLQHQDSISVYPPLCTIPLEPLIHLSPAPLMPASFVLDLHLGKLARRLRLLGFDCLYRNDYDDDEIMEHALAQQRIILTCDRGILKHRKICHGYLVRSDQVDRQVIEVLCRYDLFSQIQMWSRCLTCNGLLHDVDKGSIEHLLKPKTRRYYEKFRRCSGCEKIYWQGSHCEKINDWLASLRAWGQVYTFHKK